jgi:hypothetical protein
VAAPSSPPVRPGAPLPRAQQRLPSARGRLQVYLKPRQGCTCAEALPPPSRDHSAAACPRRSLQGHRHFVLHSGDTGRGEVTVRGRRRAHGIGAATGDGWDGRSREGATRRSHAAPRRAVSYRSVPSHRVVPCRAARARCASPRATSRGCTTGASRTTSSTLAGRPRTGPDRCGQAGPPGRQHAPAHGRGLAHPLPLLAATLSSSALRSMWSLSLSPLLVSRAVWLCRAEGLVGAPTAACAACAACIACVAYRTWWCPFI